MSQIPELLSPAGSLEKLQVAVLYGADAVYCAGLDFGLRAASDNLSRGELVAGVDFAHARGAKVFVVLNAFLHDQDFSGLGDFCRFLATIGVDGVICSDLGVMTTVGRSSQLPIHLSTQASCLNSASGRLWRRMGVRRLILGREVSLQEARAIKQQTGLEVELFVHGSLCTSYSGNCVISNYTAGRDSNRGGCAHSCRFAYTLEQGSRREQSFFMSSRDLQGLEVLDRYIDAGIDSIKIEGRMKGPIYVATATKVYREALDTWRNGQPQRWQEWRGELASFAHRDYTTASLLGTDRTANVFERREQLRHRTHQVLGTVLATAGGEAIISVKHPFDGRQAVEILPFTGPVLKVPSDSLKSLEGESIAVARQSALVRLPAGDKAAVWNMVRGRCQ